LRLPAYSASEKLIWPIVLLAPCPVQRSHGVVGGLVQTFPSAADVDRFWLDYVGDEARRVDERAFADILEAQDWFPSDLQASLVRLIDVGRIRNLDAIRRRPITPLHYKDGDRLQRTGDFS
jgi:hypothetical protein